MTAKFENMVFHTYGDSQNPDAPNLLFLHGWGTRGDTFLPLFQQLHNYNIHTVDFPGFGDSAEPSEPWDVDRYTELVIRFIRAYKLDNLTVIAHSFGGRIAIKIASSTNLLDALLLTGAAGIRPKRGAEYYFKVYSFKALRRIAGLPVIGFLFKRTFEAVRKLSGSADYHSASETMKRTLSKVVKEDLTPLLGKIEVPTLLLWGELDDATPLQDGKTMHRLIPHSELIVLKDAGHFAYFHKDFEPILRAFLEERDKTNRNTEVNA